MLPTGNTKRDSFGPWLMKIKASMAAEIATLFSEQKNPKEFLKNLKINLIRKKFYAFTTKGKVNSLPPGATALDFAFRFTPKSAYTKEAGLTGRLCPLNPLKSGDIVEIITSLSAALTAVV